MEKHPEKKKIVVESRLWEGADGSFVVTYPRIYWDELVFLTLFSAGQEKETQTRLKSKLRAVADEFLEISKKLNPERSWVLEITLCRGVSDKLG